MSVRKYKYCIVPLCTSTTVRTPEKIFFDVPRYDVERTQWCVAMKREPSLSEKGRRNICQDHFDLELDTENYMRYKLLGTKLRLKKGVRPHRFACQKDKNSTAVPSTSTKKSQKRKGKKLVEELLIKSELSTSDISSCHFDETHFLSKASDLETRKTSTSPLSSSEKKVAQSTLHDFKICDIFIKEELLEEMKLGEEQNTSTPSERILFDAMSDSNAPISERQENGRKFPGRPRKRKRGFKKVKEENSQTNCGEITSSNGIASDQNASSSMSSKKRGPFKSIYNEKKDASTDSQTNCLEISSSSGNITDLNVSSSVSSQLLPNVYIKEEKPWEEEYNYNGNSSSCLPSSKMQIEINDVRSVASAGSLSDEKVNTDQKKVPGSLSKPTKIEEREENFGKLVACEMSDLSNNPDLYLKTKQAILNLLVQARFDQMKQNGEIL